MTLTSVALTCSAEMRTHLGLQLNANKTEVIWFGSQANLARLNSLYTVHFEYCTTVHRCPRSRPSSGQRAVHEAACYKSCCYLLIPSTPASPDLPACRQWSRYSTSPRTDHIEIKLLQRNTGRLTTDYTIAPSQQVQNAAARLVFELGPREHVTLCLLQLHWLPVRWRIQFKLCCIVHSVFNRNCPAYLSDIVQTVSVSASRPRLRLWSSSSTDCVYCYSVTTTSHQVRRARFFLCWSVCMEQTARRHSRRIWHRQLSKTSQNALF